MNNLIVEELKTYVEKALEEINNLKQEQELIISKAKYFGKSGYFTNKLKEIKNIPAFLRPEFGKMLNEAKQELENALEKKLRTLKTKEIFEKESQEKIDLTYDKIKVKNGRLHPITLTRNKIVDFFVRMGYSVVEGNEIETIANNFDLLNIDISHPSRSEQDTFYLFKDYLLRTQTSTTQINVMQKGKLPIYIISPGKVYRSDAMDATHSPMFHQIEGLVVDKNINLCNLVATLNVFAKYIFGQNLKTRFRASYFPFTEPSIEMDARCSCTFGCNICKGTGFIEIMGAGIVNKKVLENCNIDSKKYSGFAFGMGIDRISNLLYGISDMRMNFENDVRFLKQF